MCPRPGTRAARAAAAHRLLRRGWTTAYVVDPHLRQVASPARRAVPQFPQITFITITASFTKGASLPTMDLRYSPEEEAFRAEVRAWLDANLPPDWRHRGVGGYREEEDEEIQREWQRRLYESGWLPLAWPRETGGMGATPHTPYHHQEDPALNYE